jgi:hypothetical protein
MFRRDFLGALAGLTFGCSDEDPMPSRFRHPRGRWFPGAYARREVALPTDIALIGTSHINNADPVFRRTLSDFIVANGNRLRIIGTRSQGPGSPFTWDDHDGQPAARLGNRRAHVADHYGVNSTFGSFPDGRMIITECWTNDFRQEVYNEATYLLEVAAYFNELRVAWPSVQKIIVLNNWAIAEGTLPAGDTMAAGRVVSFNAGLATICAAFNAGLPFPIITLIDAYTLIGPAGTSRYVVNDAYHLTQEGYQVLEPYIMEEAEPILLAA